MHVAEINIGRLNYPIDDPRMADFVNNLGRVNAMAERMPGFVWRLVGDGSNDGALELRLYADPMMAVNMSVWASVEDLENYVWNTVHKRFYNRKAEWFEPMKSHHFAMWPIEEGHIPTVEEAKARLRTSFDMIEAEMAGRTWAMGESFTIADCAASPSLYYANKVLPFRDTHRHVAAYFDRLMARPAFARVLEEAKPYAHLFPEE